MPLHKILALLDKPVDPDTKTRIIAHMKKMPIEKESVMLQCAMHLEKDNTLGALLAVVHALNDGAVFMRCADDDEDELAVEFERILEADGKKN
jgi:hypothetical protein